jgi:hypothetical protein
MIYMSFCLVTIHLKKCISPESLAERLHLSPDQDRSRGGGAERDEPSSELESRLGELLSGFVGAPVRGASALLASVVPVPGRKASLREERLSLRSRDVRDRRGREPLDRRHGESGFDPLHRHHGGSVLVVSWSETGRRPCRRAPGGLRAWASPRQIRPPGLGSGGDWRGSSSSEGARRRRWPRRRRRRRPRGCATSARRPPTQTWWRG